MPGTTAFQNIDDPLDPAWIGHWERHDRRKRQPAVLSICAAMLVCALLAVAGVIAAGADGRTRAPKSSERSVPVVRTNVPTVTIGDAPLADDGGDEALPPRPVTNAYPTGSGWAPADATIAPEERGSGLLRGDLSGLHPTLTNTLDALAVDLGRPIRVVSGWRTRHEQTVLYDRFIAGTGNLAAVPGTSNHEAGWAADAYVDGVALANVADVAARARKLGLAFPVAGEAWHVEQRR